MVGRHLVLAPRSHPLDGPAEPPREPCEQHVLAVGPALDAEAPADVGRDHADARLREPEEPRDLRPDAEGRLARHPEGQLVGGGVERGQHGAGLERHAREPRLRHAERDDARRDPTSARRVALANRPDERQVPRDVREQPRRPVGRRALGLGQRRERLVPDPDQLERVARGVRVLGHDGGDRCAGRVHVGLGDDRMGWHPHPGHEPVHRHRGQVAHLGAGDHQEHAGSAARALDVEPRDVRARVRRAQQAHVGTDEASGADEEAVVFAPLERPADPAVARVAVRLRHENAW